MDTREMLLEYNQNIDSIFNRAKRDIQVSAANAANPGLAAEMSGMYGPESAAGVSRARRPPSRVTGNPAQNPIWGNKNPGGWDRNAMNAVGKNFVPDDGLLTPGKNFSTGNLYAGPVPNTGRGAYNRAAQTAAGKAATAADAAPRSMLGRLYGGANAISKATMGVSAGKLALGAGLAVGALGALDYAIGRDPASDAGSVVGGMQRFYGAMKDASRPSYGTSAFQQSTQGLVFGLHNARTAY